MRVIKIATIFFSVVCPLIPLTVLLTSVAFAKMQEISKNSRESKQFSLQQQLSF